MERSAMPYLRAIPPDAQRQFAGRMGATTIEVPTNHVAMVSHPDEALNLITTAAPAVAAATQIRRLRLNCSRETSPSINPFPMREHLEGSA
jgi:hypothetical protein